MMTYTTQFCKSYTRNKHNPNNQNNDINMGFTTDTKFVLLQLRQPKFWSIHIQISSNFKKFIFDQFHTFHASPICAFHQSRKPVCALMNNFVHFIHPYMNLLPISCISNLCISSIPKTFMCIDEQFRTFHPSLHESVTKNGPK